MIILRYGRLVSSADNPAYLSNSKVGSLFKISGSSVRRLCLKRFQNIETNNQPISKRTKSKYKKRTLQRYPMSSYTDEQIEFITSENTLKQ